MKENTGFFKKPSIKEFISLPEKSDFLKAAAALICQRASVFGMHPFGIAFFSVFGNGEKAYLYVPAIIAGAFLSDASPLKYIMSAIMIWVWKTVLDSGSKKEYVNALIAALAIFFSGIFYAVSPNENAGLLLLFGEALLSIAAFPVFLYVKDLFIHRSKNRPLTGEHTVSIAVLLAVLLIGTDNVVFPFSVTLKYVVCIYAVLCISMYAPFSVSAMFALTGGFIACINSPDALTSASVFALSSIMSGMLRYFGMFGAVAGFLTGISCCTLFIGNTIFMPITLFDILTASILFIFLPFKISKKTGIFLADVFRTTPKRRDYRIKEYITEELNAISHTFSEFARQFTYAFSKHAADSSDSPTRVVDETAEKICLSCTHCNDCWNKYFNDTYRYMLEIYDTVGAKGCCTLSDAPLIFSQRCIMPELFLNEFNHSFEKIRMEKVDRGFKNDERKLVSSQYSEISRIIKKLSEEIEGSFFFDEHKEKKIASECQKASLYLKDINVIKNSEGYYEVFFSPGADSDKEKILDIVSDILDVRMKFTPCKNKALVRLVTDNYFYTTVSLSQRKRDNEDVCGDTVMHFETDKSKYYIILCDGMGSGTEASKESRMTAELLSGFLKAGFSKSTALNLINSTLALKMEREGFSTIDLCEIDLRSGRCEFIKVGGAQSYIKDGNSIYSINSGGLPAGILEDIPSENAGYDLSDGGMIVMLSDGISEAGYGMMKGEWIKRLIKPDTDSCNDLAQRIVNNAHKKIYPRTPDDMTAVVIELKKTDLIKEITPNAV